MALNKILLTILLLAGLNCNCQKMGFGLIKNASSVPANVPILIVFAGESNSGGLANNSSATGPELAVRTLPILDNVSLTEFDPLDIGTNNLTGHLGLIYAASTGHGWELELANRYDDGDFGLHEIYLCKAGQGGTTVAMWADEATYSAESSTVEPYDVFIARVQAAIAIIETETGQIPHVVMFWTLGINDSGIGTNAATWKAAQKAVFNLMRTDLAIDLPIYMVRMQSMSDPYGTQIAEIGTELSNITIINSTGAETTDVVAGSGSHWGYTGMKQVANSLIDALISDL